MIFIAIVVLSASFSVTVYLLIREMERRDSVWLKQIEAIREVNNALTTSIARHKGFQIDIHPSTTEPSVGWLDSKPEIVLNKEGV